MIERRATKTVRIGNLSIGGTSPIAVQSMTNTDTRDGAHTLEQIVALAAAGCKFVRVAVPDQEAATVLERLVRDSPVPIIADIHYDHRLALASIYAGVAKVRINPGNIGGWERIKEVVKAAAEHGAAIRLGINSGSLPREILERHGGPTPQALLDTAISYLDPILHMGFDQLVLSLKSSNVLHTIESYRLVSRATDLPLHLGVTEAGSPVKGSIRSAIGIGTLLVLGIGDTFRVSLTADPLREVDVAKEILASLELSAPGLRIISCPTCARTSADLISITEEVEEALKDFDHVPVKVAIMGCSVNGPGEAREADVGLALARGKAVIFKEGRPVELMDTGRAVEYVIGIVRDLAQTKG
jgi:(E)-4-hydroxy-3-methylbut-2-enyl-diphosphate synthase